jgi:phosphate transport system substrate-binding protein
VGVIPGIQEYLAEFTSEKAWGKDGYLSEKGLIPLPDAERKQVGENVKALKMISEVK